MENEASPPRVYLCEGCAEREARAALLCSVVQVLAHVLALLTCC
jgi:hypothetical protein